MLVTTNVIPQKISTILASFIRTLTIYKIVSREIRSRNPSRNIDNMI